MDYLFAEGEEFLRNAIMKKDLLLCLDFDGTLSPIASTPEEAVLPAMIKEMLEDLLSFPKMVVSVISGRALDDLKSKIGIKGIIYIGNHGFESEKGYLCEISEECRRALEMARIEWSDIAGKYEGSYFQDKNITLSLHFRNIENSKENILREEIRKTFESWPVKEKSSLHLSEGKKVFELRPNVECHKGTAMQYLIEQYPEHLPIYIGDDVTDEDAFRAVNPPGLTIRVGYRERSEAGFYINDQDETATVLKLIKETR
jgi:trehalose-phosphatase